MKSPARWLIIFLSLFALLSVGTGEPEGRRPSVEDLTIDDFEAPKQSEESKPQGRLYVNTEPSDAQVRIMNIGPRYQRGMELDDGQYDVEVSRAGYRTWRKMVKVASGEDLKLDVRLEKEDASLSGSSSSSWSQGARPTPTGGEIKIGVYLPMTGAIAAYGEMEWSGIQIANQMEPDVLGSKITLVLMDTKSDKTEAGNAVRRLVNNERVVGILGEAISGSSMAANPISEEARIPTVSPSATNPMVTEGKKYAFRACFIDPFQGEMAARFARKNLRARTAALIVDVAQEYCVGLGNQFVREFNKQGGQVVSTTHIKTGDQDFSTACSAVKNTRPDVVYAPNYYTEVALLARQLRDSGVNLPIITGDGAQADALIEVGGTSVENMYFTSHFHKEAATTKRAKEYVKRFEAKYQKEVDAFGALGADTYFLLVDAIRRAGSLDGPDISKALASTSGFSGVTGTIQRMESGNPTKSMVINMVKNGRFQFVTSMEP